MENKMIYIEFEGDLCGLEVYEVIVGDEFTAKTYGVVSKPSKNAFNCQLGHYEETCVEVYRMCGKRKVLMFNSFIKSNLGKMMERTYDNTFFGIFKTREDAVREFNKIAKRKISSLESEIKKAKDRAKKIETSLTKTDESGDDRNV